MKLSDFYSEVSEHAFFVASWNLFHHSEVPKILEKYNFLPEEGDNRHKLHHGFKVYKLKQEDEFNFLFVRVATTLELSLKGIAVMKKFNIFKNFSRKLTTYEKLDDAELQNLKTFEFNFFIENIGQLMEKEQVKKFRPMLEFFRDKRNEFAHFAKMKNGSEPEEILKNFQLAKEYFDLFIFSLKEKSSLKRAKRAE